MIDILTSPEVQAAPWSGWTYTNTNIQRKIILDEAGNLRPKIYRHKRKSACNPLYTVLSVTLDTLYQGVHHIQNAVPYDA